MFRMLLAAVLLAGVAQAGEITVSGTGGVSAVPDLAYFSVSVSAKDEDAGKCLAATTAKMAKLLEALRSEGVKSEELKTNDVDLRPVYRDRDRKDDPETYEGSVTLLVTVCDRAKVGKLMTTAVKAGGTSLGNLSFGFSDSKKLEERAMKAAMADARLKAELLAGSEKLKLGWTKSISESTSYGNRVLYQSIRAQADAGIEPGTRRTTASVTVVWETIRE